MPFHTPELDKILTDENVWKPALDADGDIRGAAVAVAEITPLLSMDGWPKDMRVMV